MDEVGAVLYALHHYQNKNNITGQCVTNVSTFIDIARQYIPNKITAKAFVCVGWNDEKNEAYIVCGHLVVDIDGLGIFDPSYEIHKLKNTKYCESFKALNCAYNTREETKRHLKEHLEFIKIAERINNGEFLIHNQEHYDKQLEFIEEMLPKQLTLLPLKEVLLKLDKEKAMAILEKLRHK